MMMLRGAGSVVCVMMMMMLVICCGGVTGDKGESLTDECADKFQKVMACLNYATGKEAVPSKTCCGSVEDIKESDPKCLCFVLQQAHNGSAQIKSLGIQEQKLLQLPSACKLQNASLADCPKYLGLAPNSPEASIFTNAPTTAAPAATSTGKATPATAAPKDAGSATKNGPYLAAASLMVVAAIFIQSSSMGSAFYI